MTCIVGLKHKGIVYLGGDSCVSYGWEEKRPLVEPKVVHWGKFLLGMGGAHRFSQLIEYEVRLPKQRKKQTDLDYLVTRFAHEVKTVLNYRGFSDVENNKESASGEMLLAYKGRLYRMTGDFSIVEHADSYDAIGVGSSYALGAFHATEGRNLSAKRRIKLALQAATRFSNGVDSHYVIIKEKR